MRKKHFLSLERLLRSARPSWESRHGADSFSAVVDLCARFCSLWASKFDAERFRAEVLRR
jgi:hypothetical protein